MQAKPKPQRWEILGDLLKCYIDHRDGSQSIILLDLEDFDLVSKYRWGRAGTFPGFPQSTIKVQGKVKISRLVMGLPDEKLEVDHINGNVWDNRKKNLRICTPEQNSMNKGTYKNSSTGYRGISFRPSLNKFRVRIWGEKKCLFSCHCDTLENAIAIYNREVKTHHGEFARKD